MPGLEFAGRTEDQATTAEKTLRGCRFARKEDSRDKADTDLIARQQIRQNFGDILREYVGSP